jgi:hypothetical protein
MAVLPRTPSKVATHKHEECDAEIADLVDELKAAAEAPLTAEDLAWFESLPELQPLEEGQTFAVFFKRSPGSALSNPHSEPETTTTADAAALRRRRRLRGTLPGEQPGHRPPGRRR